ncbi:helix-turn-helix domain-containing protein [Caulobacter sp. RL271]|jgi:cytoskeletal protein RodZ|uniref:Helix-turn-helix domain-containing protein n=1 Tax=Caulobacter segnis TaxID=88688 RepID=A0ABY4ZWR3_9CAUL|nr:helix-turn-helix domain-containing protein [Caulobacter segnis]USQ97084.1 helix-turn-helix domain-containing protein [Caulobacter segnis]
MPLDMGNVRRLRLVADADDVATEAHDAPVLDTPIPDASVSDAPIPDAPVDAPVVVRQPSLDDGADIGQALRSARTARGMSAQTVAEATRIRQSYIEALEEMRLDELPSRPFTIGYIRAYASLLGLDPEAAVSRFKADAPDEGGELRAPVGVRRERDPRLAMIFAGGVLVVGAILLWNLAQRAIAKDEPPAQVASAATSAQVQAHASNSQVALGAPLPAPVESTTPEPYKTPGLDDAAANGGSVDAAKAAAKARAEAEARAGIIDPALRVNLGAPFKPKGAVMGASPAESSGVILQARKAATLVVRGGDGQVYFARALAAGEAYRAPRTAGLIADVSDPAVFDVYGNGALTGRLPSNSTALGKLIPPPAAPVAVAPKPVAPSAAPAVSAPQPTAPKPQ